MERINKLWTRTILYKAPWLIQFGQQWFFPQLQSETFFRQGTSSEGQLTTTRRRPTRRSYRKSNRSHGDEVADLLSKYYKKNVYLVFFSSIRLLWPYGNSALSPLLYLFGTSEVLIKTRWGRNVTRIE
ncbi:uncharacterized protein LOC143783194 [Ranitomeya variabilis]|uniref:uncharacterized protein LOC143783194 n=1 Tax=Ranitomeya variabilis TaxID=490064 RepID=UPI0040565B67